MELSSYSFGKIVVDGVQYTKDLKIIGGKVIPNWWRQQGHLLQACDIEDVVEARPHTLIVGTGSPGRLKVEEGLASFLGSKGIRLETLPTELAVHRFMELAEMEGYQQVAAALHLTC